MAYVYIQSEPGLWTVGYYDPDGKWEPLSDHSDQDDALARVAWLNGNDPEFAPNKEGEQAMSDFTEGQEAYAKVLCTGNWVVLPNTNRAVLLCASDVLPAAEVDAAVETCKRLASGLPRGAWTNPFILAAWDAGDALNKLDKKLDLRSEIASMVEDYESTDAYALADNILALVKERGLDD